MLLGSFLQPALRQVGWILRSAYREVYTRREGLGERWSPWSRTNRCPLTWSFSDAARQKARRSRYDFPNMAFPQVLAMMIGQFVLAPRRREWDEVLVLVTIEGCPEVMAYTTTEDDLNFQWMVLRAAPGQVPVATLPDEGAEGRRAPEGVAEGSVNWICVPPTLTEKWTPTVPEMMQLHNQARAMARDVRATCAVAQIAVTGADLSAFPCYLAAQPLPPGGGQGGALGLVGLGEAGPGPALPLREGLAALAADPAGLGFPDAGAPAAVGRSDLELSQMAEDLERIRADIRRSRDKKERKDKDRKDSRDDSRDRDKKKKKKGKDKDKKKHKKGGRRRRRSSSSSTSRSRSTSSASSSSSSGGRLIRWRARGRDRSVDPRELRELEAKKFKARGELLSFAARKPGALRGYFLSAVHQRLSHGPVRRTASLRNASVAQWAAQHSGLTEVRDQREVATLAQVMDFINLRTLEEAMDVISQRIVAIQQAKKKGGSWEKAEHIELTNPMNAAAAPSGLLRLTA